MARQSPAELIVTGLAERTGYCFKDAALAAQALNHASAAAGQNASNERLEFLGDRVLGLVIADHLYRRFPLASQGELSVRLNALVRAETCAEIAAELDLLVLIRADTKVKRQSGTRANKVLADAMEALIGAIYLDGGWAPAREFVLRFWSPRAEAAIHAIRDPKTLLNEFALRRAGVTPVYVLEDMEGPDHEPRFTVRANVPGFEPVRGTGRSKQAAQQDAAEAFLRREGVISGENAE
jgi:ribonuclease-3